MGQKQTQKRVKVPVIKTNKVSTRNFGLGRKRRAKMTSNSTPTSIAIATPKQIVDEKEKQNTKKLPSSPINSTKSSPALSSETANHSSSPTPISLNKKRKKRRRKKKTNNDLKVPSEPGNMTRSSSNSSSKSNASCKSKKRHSNNGNPPPLMSVEQSQSPSPSVTSSTSSKSNSKKKK